MRRATAPLLGLIALAVTISTIATVILLLDGGRTVSAREVAERVEVAHLNLVDGLGPNSTLHVVQTAYTSQQPVTSPFGLPERYAVEWWAVFGDSGSLVELRSETHDEVTGELVQHAEYVDGSLIMTDAASGEIRAIDGFAVSVDEISERIGAAQIVTSALVSPDAGADSGEVDGVDAYVIEMDTGSDGKVRRAYIDKDTYRELKWELVDPSGQLLESRATIVFEVLHD